MHKLNLYIGCNGNANKDGFVFCKSCSNLLIDIETVQEKEKVINFLDKAAGLFSGPIENHSKAFNTLNYIHKNFHIFNEDKILSIQKFFNQHKECGVFIVLLPEK